MHVFVDGRIAEQGGPELAEQLEAEGYDKYLRADGLTMSDRLPGSCRSWRSSARTSRSSSARSRTGRPLVYLDSANTSQKPQVVIDAMVDHLERHNANIARAMHQLGAESTEAYEAARDKVAAFLNAPSRNEVVFTKNATEALNLLARTIDLGPGDNVVITEMEHHSNIVSWQLACERSRRRAALVRPHRRRPARPVERRPAGRRAHQGRRLHLGLQHARHHQPGRRPRGPRARRSAPTRSSTPRRPSRSCRSTSPPPGATSWSSPATRPSARPASACSGDARSCSTSSRRSTAAAR